MRRASYPASGLVMGVVLLLLGWGIPGRADDDGALTSTLHSRVTSVAVFKNGYGLYFREGRARPTDGWLMADHLPFAALGSVWIYTLGEKDLVDRVISAKQTELSFAGAEGLARLLSERIGARVAFETIDGKQFDGELKGLVEGMAMLEGQGSLIALKLDTVKTARLVDLPLRIKVATGKPVDVAMTYLQTGLRWLPTYCITPRDGNKASLILRATLVNDAEDLVDSTVHFVVGVPSFTYQGELDPLALNRVGAAIQPRFDISALRNQAGVDAEGARGEPGAAGPPGLRPRDLPNLPGEDVGELFMYKVEHVDLKVGEVAMLTVFQETAPYREVYQWDADTPDVWSCLKLTNSTSMPWTTAPAAVYRDWRMLGQNTLNYTPLKGEKVLPVTVSRDIGVGVTETELGREYESTPREGYHWTAVTLEAAAALQNYMDKPAEITVTKTVVGELLANSDEPTISRSRESLQAMNPTNLLTWTVTLGAGEKKTLTWKYKTLVRQ
ncbi:MAG: DUF4139 domain-containing protein [Armatimonadetes bacterium]|nr:DUF4139 domain-containing protein [Armatimonadota bacterium]